MFVDWLTFFENTVERFRNPVDGRVSVPYGAEFSLAGINLIVMNEWSWNSNPKRNYLFLSKQLDSAAYPRFHEMRFPIENTGIPHF